jgi:hypothetical protein
VAVRFAPARPGLVVESPPLSASLERGAPPTVPTPSRRARRLLPFLAIAWLGPAGASAQVRPFIYTVTTAPGRGERSWTAFYDAGYADRTTEPFGFDGVEQRLGVEAIGEDLEGLWEAEEAEGGAKLYIGPAIHWARSDGRLWASLGGGPVVYASRSDARSPAPRPLGADGNGFTVRMALGITFFRPFLWSFSRVPDTGGWIQVAANGMSTAPSVFEPAARGARTTRPRSSPRPRATPTRAHSPVPRPPPDGLPGPGHRA